MNLPELLAYVRLSKYHSMSIERITMDKYPGIMREISIINAHEIAVEFLDKFSLIENEGEITFYLEYENEDAMVLSLERFIGKKLEDWSSYNNKDWTDIPSVSNSVLAESWRKLQVDFVNNKIEFPHGEKDFFISDLYWRALKSGELNVDSSEEEIVAWVRKQEI